MALNTSSLYSGQALSIHHKERVADGANSVILEQVTNGIAVRMAVLFWVSQAKDKDIKNEIAY